MLQYSLVVGLSFDVVNTVIQWASAAVVLCQNSWAGSIYWPDVVRSE